MLKIGVIGAGFIGQLGHIDNYAMIDACQIVGLAELRPKLRHLVAQRYAIPRTYSTHRELLKDPEVEAVVAVTAGPMTGPVALDCLRAGKHLLTEKPMAATVEQARELVDTARAQGLCYSVGYLRRHDEGVQRAKGLLEDLLGTGELGPITFVRSHCFMGDSYCNIDGHVVTDEPVPAGRPEWPIAPDWVPKSRQRDYAWFLNVYCHNINLLRYLLGNVQSVAFVRLEHQYGRVVGLDFGDYLAVLEAGRSDARVWDEVIEIYFAHGRLSIKLPPGLLRNVPATIELYKGGDRHELYSPLCDWTWAFRRQAQNFVLDVQEHREPVASGADALEDLQLIENIWRSDLSAG